MRRIVLAAVVALALVACGGDDDSDARACDDVFADGRPTSEVLADVEVSCDTSDGPMLYGVATEDCVSRDAQWHYNDRGYGVDGGEWRARDGVTPQLDDDGNLTLADGAVC